MNTPTEEEASEVGLFASEEGESGSGEEPDIAVSQAPNSMKIDALRRLKALERRGKTVGTHLDELRTLLTLLFELLPDQNGGQ